ncbi:uncharacterized protein MELLADRAFT_70948 [Melampsora larici-populina 98AG31]|uniref:Secreted protein n=1 Tax=Melampsora larici-populina (strain 98AG31 / pathotype 3-4-7) TaxID=747676 RepID=F4RA66_MELLP|nr:uncharacterized protein MELLADRAFT_70948 [Melampsora larici-populina 98AG31]EGG10835.1 hypothetical protein MELLADRAFT_70948 [Melampsora larici-populina 98AG31]
MVWIGWFVLLIYTKAILKDDSVIPTSTTLHQSSIIKITQDLIHIKLGPLYILDLNKLIKTDPIRKERHSDDLSFSFLIL